MKFKNKQDLTDWAYTQFEKYDIPKPETYTEQELIDLNPAVPRWHIRQHVKERDSKK